MNPQLSDAENIRELERQGFPPGEAAFIIAIEKGEIDGDAIEVTPEEAERMLKPRRKQRAA